MTDMSSTQQQQFSLPSIYIQPSINSTMSSTSLPEPAQKAYATDVVDLGHPFSSLTSNYQNSNQYTQQTSLSPSSAEGPRHHHSTTTQGGYTPYSGQDILELHHAMEYRNAGYVDVSRVTSTVDNTLQAPEAYLQYP
jgi:hypothetical protein